MADSTRTRQQYARLLAENDNDYSPGSSSSVGDSSSEDIPMTPRSRSRRAKKIAKVEKRVGYLPTARRFWADFTLGFADGLTVPFALTAGLSSLGRTDTVVYAGLAEVSAGCISMGIGGYLSARQAAAGGSDENKEASNDDIESSSSSPEMEEKTSPDDIAGVTATAHRYLSPLALPSDLHQQILAHVTSQPHAAQGLLTAVDRKTGREDDDDFGFGYYEPPTKEADDDSCWPVAAGISVALGYLIGGFLPLWPYFFVTHVGDGLRYSFAVCIVALFLFGFIKDFVLDSPPSTTHNGLSSRRRIPWRRLWKSTFEGLQMVILGGIAAIAAVLCVRLFEGANTSSSS